MFSSKNCSLEPIKSFINRNGAKRGKRGFDLKKTSFPRSLCVHPDGVTVASGQVKGHGDEAKVSVTGITMLSRNLCSSQA